MVDRLKQFNEDLYDRFQDIEQDIAAYSRSVYVTMQSFCEALFKQVATEKDLAIDSRSTLGKLMTDQHLTRIITDDYGIRDHKPITELNSLGNRYKHEKTLIIDEEELLHHYMNIVAMLKRYLQHHDIKPDDTAIEARFEGLMKEIIIPDEAVRTLIDDKEKEIESLKSKISKSENTIGELRDDLNQTTPSKDQQNDLKTKIAKTEENIKSLESEIGLLNQQRDAIIDRASNEPQNKRVALDKKRLKIEKAEMRRHQQLEDEKSKLDELQKKNRQDNTGVDATKAEAIIDRQSRQIRELQVKINHIEREKGKIKHWQSSRNYENKSRLLDQIRFKGHSIFFHAGYETSHKFDITNLTLSNHAKSRHKHLYAVTFNLLTRGKCIRMPRSLKERNLNKETVSTVYTLQLLMLGLVKEGLLNDDTWEITIEDRYQESASIAFEEIMEWMKILGDLQGIKFEPPLLKFKDDTRIDIRFDTATTSDNTFIIRRTKYIEKPSNVPLWIEDQITYDISRLNKHHISHLHTLLYNLFGFDQFREGQLDILINFLNGNNTIGILPTGGGKSLTYYISVLLQPKSSLIIAPLNSLIKDQLRKLSEEFGISKVANLTSENKKFDRDMEAFESATIQFTFASPERAQSKKFRDTLITLSHTRAIGSVILDEVHCLSEWGHDFRIPYLMLSEILNTYCRDVRYLGLTATASVSVVKDLVIELGIKDIKNVIYSRHLKRANLDFAIRVFENQDVMRRKLKSSLKKNYDSENSIFNFKKQDGQSNSGIIFCRTKRGDASVEGLYEELKPIGINGEIDYFHGENKKAQDPYIKDEKTLLIATKAFGMGVDKPNIRFTIHFGMPSSKENFYQEAGRAGRDGEDAHCFLFTHIDLPEHHGLISEFLNLNTGVTRMKEIQEMLKFKCSIATNFFFLIKDMQTPEDETQAVIDRFNDIIKASKTCTFKINEGSKAKNETYFYILHKLGIVNNWHVNYNGHEILLHVEINSRANDFEHIKYRAWEYLSLYKANRKELDFIDTLEKIEALDELVLHVRKWYHRNFIRGRREQLANMYEFIKNYSDESCSDAIQAEMEQFFDLKPIIGEVDMTQKLDFDDKSFADVVKQALELTQESLYRARISMERLLESYSNNKLDVFTSLLHLRQGSFQSDRNGKERFDYALKNMEKNEIVEVIEGLKSHYQSLSEYHRLDIINALSPFDETTYLKLIETNRQCRVLNGIHSQTINKKLAAIWSD